MIANALKRFELIQIIRANLPLSTVIARAYFRGRVYIKIILKNHSRSYYPRNTSSYLLTILHTAKL